MLISIIQFPYPYDTVRTSIKVDSSMMLQRHVIILKTKADRSDCQMPDWCECQSGIN